MYYSWNKDGCLSVDIFLDGEHNYHLCELLLILAHPAEKLKTQTQQITMVYSMISIWRHITVTHSQLYTNSLE